MSTKKRNGKAQVQNPVEFSDGLCAVCLGTGKYQREFNAPTHWRIEQFSPTHWRIIGRLKTLNDGDSREEVMGVAEYSEAVRIRDNHNGEIDELLRLVRRGAWTTLLEDLRAFGESCRREGA